MAHKDRTYDVEIAMTGNPPAPRPILTKDGHVIGPDDLIIFDKNADQMKKVDHYRVRFVIKNFKDSPLRFVPNAADVMWVHEGTECPTSFCELPGVIWVDDVDKHGEWIDAINMDMTQLRFQFTLNFADKNIANPTTADYVPLDPGGGNQNGGLSGSDISSAVDLSTGFFGGVAGGLGAVLATGVAATAPNLVTAGLVGGIAALVVLLVINTLRKRPPLRAPVPTV